ncbi:hypothetical protein EGT74_16290 [Chitinophaga lutea]|uniref:Uncharacterized protein n=1 Tax=Chitinophaga lutea TaxID=2488634 RepID=A0A3N4PPI8_9BACT|nr:hypothetical protein [Chitinophaga lutea]RPE08599.1 hypothetical protein EGT74_16290 [Chitinophaga lutea]
MLFPDLNGYSEDTSFNIDIEFLSVSYINVPASLPDIAIREVSADLLPENTDKRLLQYDEKVFELLVDGRTYYVIAGGMLVGTNRRENKDRIADDHQRLRHDSVLVTA